MKIEIYPPGGNIVEHPLYYKRLLSGEQIEFLSHAIIEGVYGCKLSGKYLCHDNSLLDQNGLPTCPTCSRKVKKARSLQ
jgi:hypothetical protein